MDQQPKGEQLPKKEIQISHATKDRVEACKQYIERKYARSIQEEKDKKEQWQQLTQKMQDLKMKSLDQDFIKGQILTKESELLRKKRQRVSAQDFEPLKIIGRGAFGEVRVCKYRETGEVVAIKKMKKVEMLAKNQIAHVRAERDVLALSQIPWIVDLKFSFQDDKYLYLVMEYLPGGDLMTLLMKKDILSEEDSKFYIAELILAVDAIHKMNFIHRDLKPDNILIDNLGHLKLSDFGLCKHTEIKPRIDFGRKTNEPVVNKFDPSVVLTKRPQNFKRNRQLAFSTVGTPDYIAPEVFSQQGYTETVDWWSVGVILFEMVVGYPPFFSDDPQTTCQKILHWKKTFSIPSDPVLSQPCIDLIRKLIGDPQERLGINGVQEIKAHPFFFGVDWRRIRDKPTPHLPEIKSDLDTDNFEAFTEEDPWYVCEGKKRGRKANFHGYSFKRDQERDRSPIQLAMDDLENFQPLPSKSQSPLPLDANREPTSFLINRKPNTNLLQKGVDHKQVQFIKNNLQNVNQQMVYNYNLYHTGAKSNSPQNKSSIKQVQPLNSARGGNTGNHNAAINKNQFLMNNINNSNNNTINNNNINNNTINNNTNTSGIEMDSVRNITQNVKGNTQANQLLAMLSQLTSQQPMQAQRNSKLSLNTNQTKNVSQVIVNKFNINNSTQNYLLAQAALNNSNQGILKLPTKKVGGGLPNLNTQGSPKQQKEGHQGNIQVRQQLTYQYGTKERDGSPKYKN